MSTAHQERDRIYCIYYGIVDKTRKISGKHALIFKGSFVISSTDILPDNTTFSFKILETKFLLQKIIIIDES